MKFRDVVLLLVGGGLVVVGMLMGNLIENDAIADSHGSKAVEYEYKVGDFNDAIYYFTYYQGNLSAQVRFDDLKKTKRLYSTEPFSRIELMITNETRNGWILLDYEMETDNSRDVLSRDKDRVSAVFKRIKQ